MASSISSDLDRIKGPWSPEEDEALQSLVKKHGPRNWSLISKSIPGRSGKSCHLRWCDLLSPGVENRPFSSDEDEDDTIIRAHAKFGNKERQDDRKNQGHPLPLPPSPPNSPPKHLLRNNSANEGVLCLHSRWKKGKHLGSGTFGRVYAGFNSENGQMCAIKEVELTSDDQNSNECLQQLNQEITLLSQLSHQNIVQYYGSELNDSTLSVYLEYVSGGSIHKLLQEYGPFKESVIQSFIGQILSGLVYLHGRKIVHRDIKGANILVDPNGQIKLVDFGMAKLITPSSTVMSFKGSPYWMAPEVILNHNGYNLAVDIWSLGCTILEMATSKPPWSNLEAVAAIFKIGKTKEIPPIPDHFSEDGKDFLKLCLQRDPSARPTAAQLLEHPFVRDQATFIPTEFNSIRYAMQFNTDISYQQGGPWGFFDFTVPYGHYHRRHDFPNWPGDIYSFNRFPDQCMDARAHAQQQEQEYQNICNALLKQIEDYFSDDNLVKDYFLRSNMDGEGWVFVEVISAFRRVKRWTDDEGLILKALQPSTVVEVQGNKMRRRGNWMVWISLNGSSSSKSPTPHKQVSIMKNLKLDGDSKAEPC